MAEDFVIEMLHITKEFPGIKANDDITLQLRKGEVHALLGENGAGKSTLMNLLTGEERSIVTSYAGTTRDIVEETVRLGSLLLHLADTAGLRETDDPVEEDRRQDETKQANHVELDKQRGIKLIAKCDQPPGSRDG